MLTCFPHQQVSKTTPMMTLFWQRVASAKDLYKTIKLNTTRKGKQLQARTSIESITATCKLMKSEDKGKIPLVIRQKGLAKRLRSSPTVILCRMSNCNLLVLLILLRHLLHCPNFYIMRLIRAQRPRLNWLRYSKN